MGMRISTNLASIAAQRQLAKQSERNSHSLQALASGSRIVHAADDAAGLAISENLRSQVRGQNMAKQNASNAISLVQTSEGGLNEITNIMVRLRELGVQASSDTIGDDERAYVNQEGQQLLEEADRIAKTTRFGKRSLLDGSAGELEFQVGANGGDDDVIKYNVNSDATASALGVSGIGFDTKSSSRAALDKLDGAMTKLGQMRADYGAVQSRLQATVSNLDVQNENLQAANSRIRDADVAQETAEMASSGILQQAAVAVMSQANAQPVQALRLIA